MTDTETDDPRSDLTIDPGATTTYEPATLEPADGEAPLGFSASQDMVDALSMVLAAADDWPQPGSGQTLARWQALSALGERDLVLARLAEAHADAVSILLELGATPAEAGSRWGVWAAEVPGHQVVFDDGQLDGAKAWCSGATLLTHALVTSRGRLLVRVDLAEAGVSAGADSWAWPGMHAADTRTVQFDHATAEVVGEVGAYLDRPGFWMGAIGVAACWYGGAVGLAAPLRNRVARANDPHAAAHLGGVDIALGAARDVLHAAAAAIDAAPDGDHRRLARRVRGTVAQTATDVSQRVGRALGPAPYASNREHALRVADLEVYVRQDHAERDLAALGGDVASGEADWSL